MIDEEFKMLHYRTIFDVIEGLKANQKTNLGCTLLIGAGCSKSAGIPLASEFIQIIQDEYPRSYAYAKEKTYSMCMEQLNESHRRQLFIDYVDSATINEAHLCIASLVKAGYIDRILTTNFDQLVVQACALLGEFPAVYDFAASQLLKPRFIPPKAVFHLHGQRTGFVLLNTPEELQQHSRLLGPLIEDSMNERMWIVVGYSGTTDGVFNQLVNGSSSNSLYWIGFEDHPPPEAVAEKLLAKNKAWYVPSYNADTFFRKLTVDLGIHPPDLVSRPFTHLEQILDKLKATGDLTRTTRSWLQTAATQFEKTNSVALLTGFMYPPVPFDSSYKQLVREFQDFISYLDVPGRQAADIQADRVARTHIKLGDMMVKDAFTMQGEEAQKLYEDAFEKYQTALSRKPESHEAYNNWGVGIFYQAQSAPRDQATALFTAAVDKFKAAIEKLEDGSEQNQRSYEPYNNTGAAYYEIAMLSEGEEKIRLLNAAVAKYRQALARDGRAFNILNNLGCALLELARCCEQINAPNHLKEAIRFFDQALAPGPVRLSIIDKLRVINNLGAVYLEQTKNDDNSESNSESDNDLDDFASVDPLGNDLRKTYSLAESIRTGAGSYMTACRYAIMGIEPDCKDELIRIQKRKQLPAKAYLLRDPNLENVRSSEWFQQLIETEPAEENEPLQS
jgi:tetratricopeptide (TPR) repeat protein